MPNDYIEEVLEDLALDVIEDVIEGHTEGDEVEAVTESTVVPVPFFHYPEHEKLKKISDKSQAIYDFIEWINHKKEIYLSEWVTMPGRRSDPVLSYARTSTHSLLAEFFGIDQSKIDTEKETMLELIRKGSIG